MDSFKHKQNYLLFQENEMVVERALKRFDDKFSLLDLMPSWEHRGLDSFEFGLFLS